MGEEHRINEIKGVIISRALLKEYGYDGDKPTDKQMQVIGNGLLEYWGDRHDLYLHSEYEIRL